MTTIYLVRHGANDWLDKRLAGRLPGVSLNSLGRNQAQAAANWLAQKPIQAIYSSPLERAAETAQPLSARLNLPVVFHEGLLEMNFGVLQGKTVKQLARLKVWQTLRRSPSEVHFEGGETYAAAQARVSAALQELAAAHDGTGDVACFSHADTIRLAVTHFLRMPLDEFVRLDVSPGSITTLIVTPHTQRLLMFNFCPSLDGADVKH